MSAQPDFYKLLGVKIDATTKEISKAYRQKALKVHPDKVGPDDKEALDMFLLLTQAVDCLSDSAKRAEYDIAHKAVLAKEARIATLDLKRKQARDDLELRESMGLKKAKTEEMNEAEIKRLREDGLRRLAEMAKEVQGEREEAKAKRETGSGTVDHALSVQWDPEVVKTSISEIEAMYSTFGEIDTFLVGKKGAKAVLLYKKASDAEKIYRNRTSFKDYQIKWSTPRKESETKETVEAPKPSSKSNATSGFSFNIGPISKSTASMEQYESETLRRMRARAEAMKSSNE
ncbi:DnaJ-domain-containing protein [Rhizoclosmatium globosum]|uniref:DnaJ-domain-containing protein n=1 Tax=Rhizoclosmatium globosum TaxID=329046 RepID=A0A1Y2BUB3_9FUNG|nr:DnaJ-domain-containing protein [Rhizoclosmatium globosum]|eukprot:ORY38352.1 DnaJ-domain-containing protein [Rhizoclosmatium globosum]